MADKKKSETKTVKPKVAPRSDASPEKEVAPKSAKTAASKPKAKAGKTTTKTPASSSGKLPAAPPVVSVPKVEPMAESSAIHTLHATLLSGLEHYESLWIAGGRLGNFVHDFQAKIRQIETMLDDMVLDRRDRSASIIEAMQSLELDAIQADTTRSFWSKLFGTLPHDVFLSGVLKEDSKDPKTGLRDKLKRLADHFR